MVSSDVVASASFATVRPLLEKVMCSIENDDTDLLRPGHISPDSGTSHPAQRLDQAMSSVDQAAFLSRLNLSASDSSRVPQLSRKPAVSITIIEDDALSLRPKRRFCANGGDAGTDQLHVLGLLRRLLAIPVSSPLGRRMIQYVETNLPCVGSCLNPCTVAHTLFGSNGTPEYGAFCRAAAKNGLSARLPIRQFPIRFRQDSTLGHCHQYCFSRADRREFCKRYDTGLCSRSRRLQKRFGNGCISLYQLTLEEIEDWRTSQRLRDIVENPRPVFYINLIDSDESESEKQTIKQTKNDNPFFTSATSSGEPKASVFVSSARSAKQTAYKTVPTILKRRKNIEASNSNTLVITLSSDSEEDEPVLNKTYTFHCHRCTAKFSCGPHFNELVESHYRIEHSISNVNLQYHTAPNGDVSLSVVQASSTSARSETSSMPARSKLTEITESLPAIDFQLQAPRQLAPVNGVKPLIAVVPIDSRTMTSWAFSVPANGAHETAIASRMVATTSVVPASCSFVAATSAAEVFICQGPVTSSLSISRMRGIENNVVTPAFTVLSNCSLSLINGVSSPTLSEPDVICLD